MQGRRLDGNAPYTCGVYHGFLLITDGACRLTTLLGMARLCLRWRPPTVQGRNLVVDIAPAWCPSISLQDLQRWSVPVTTAKVVIWIDLGSAEAFGGYGICLNDGTLVCGIRTRGFGQQGEVHVVAASSGVQRRDGHRHLHLDTARRDGSTHTRGAPVRRRGRRGPDSPGLGAPIAVDVAISPSVPSEEAEDYYLSMQTITDDFSPSTCWHVGRVRVLSIANSASTLQARQVHHQ